GGTSPEPRPRGSRRSGFSARPRSRPKSSATRSRAWCTPLPTCPAIYNSLFPVSQFRRVDVSESSSTTASASVRADILQKYPDLFGTKTIGGRKANVEELIARLTRATRDEFAVLMQARHQLHDRVAHRQGQYDFLDPATEV